MNYFKRPSYNAGKIIEALTKEDYANAYKISGDIIDVLQPELIVFLSKKAYRAFCDADGKKANKYGEKYNNKIKSVCHPSSPWWNRKRKNGKCAREEFYEYISKLYK